jgi:polysaccharide biosynthesis protein PslH
MHILILAPYPPYPPRGGGALRIYHLLKGLAAQHQVTCLTFAPNEAAVAALAPLRDYCRVETVLGPPPRTLQQRALTTLASPLPDMAHRNASGDYAAALRALLAHEAIDVIQAESIEMAQFLLAVSGVGKAIPLRVLDEFNAEYLLQKRTALNDLRGARSVRKLAGGLYSLVQWFKLAAYERQMLQGYHHTLVVSAEDRLALQRLHRAASLPIIPNGVDTDHFSPTHNAQRTTHNARLVFTGTLDYRPNIDAVRWFAEMVLPLVRAQQPEASFVVVGRNPAPAVQALHNGTSIEVLGEVPDVRPYIASAAAYLVPMRIGGGVRLKLLEALAMEAPIVSTGLGAEGVEGLRDGEHLLLADSPQPFAEAVVRLFNDRQLAHQLGRAGRTLVQASYDWQAIVPRLMEVYGKPLGPVG